MHGRSRKRMSLSRWTAPPGGETGPQRRIAERSPISLQNWWKRQHVRFWTEVHSLWHGRQAVSRKEGVYSCPIHVSIRSRAGIRIKLFIRPPEFFQQITKIRYIAIRLNFQGTQSVLNGVYPDIVPHQHFILEKLRLEQKA